MTRKFDEIYDHRWNSDDTLTLKSFVLLLSMCYWSCMELMNSHIKLYMTMYIFSYSCIKCDNYLEILIDISCKHFRTNIKKSDLVDMNFFFLKLYYFFIDGMKCLVHNSHINKSFEFWDEFWVIFFFRQTEFYFRVCF